MAEAILDQTKKSDLPWALRTRNRAHDYALLLKPRVMSLVVFTGLVGLVMAPGDITLGKGLLAILCIAVGAGASGAINMWYDRDIDAHMCRTQNRPLPAGRLNPPEALWLGVALTVLSVVTMTIWVNATSGSLLALTIAYYVFIYTIWLKRRTPQNIVVGGASGAFPPMIGWAAVTGGLDWGAVALFMIIFVWTPPHFWSLALFRSEDYRRVKVPMLPVAVGRRETERQIMAYTILLLPISLAPAFIGMTTPLYGVVALLLGLRFIQHAWWVNGDATGAKARPMFFYSIQYLFLIFLTLLADKGLSTLL